MHRLAKSLILGVIPIIITACTDGTANTDAEFNTTSNAAYVTQVPTAQGSALDQKQGMYQYPTPTYAYPTTLVIPNRGLQRIVLVPVDRSGNQLVNYVPQSNDCVIWIVTSIQGINIYPDLRHTFNRYLIGYLYASDGVIEVEHLSWDEFGMYRWAEITVRGIHGWVHADPPWTAEQPTCAIEAFKA